MDNNTFDLISLIVSFLNLFAIVFAGIQIRISRKHSIANHDEHRREKTVDVLAMWNQSSQKDFRFAEKIVENFNDEQCRDLYNNDSLCVKEKDLKLICELCTDYTCSRKKSQYINQPYSGSNKSLTTERSTSKSITMPTKRQNTKQFEQCNCQKNCDGFYVLDGTQVNQLRWNVTSYLNNLETVFTAYFQGVVDKKTIETQFSYLYRPERNRNALCNYRNIAGGGNSYPAIELFMKILQKNHQKIVEEKAEIDAPKHK